MSGRTERYASLQVARAIAAISVVLVHVWGVTGHVVETERGSIFAFGQAGVDLFFLISGFIISLVIQTNQTAISFLVRRFARIIPFYWFFTLVWLIMLWLGHKPFPSLSSVGLSLFVAPQASPPVLTVGWSLTHEFVFYFIAAALVWLGRQSLLVYTLIAFSFVAAAGNIAAPDLMNNSVIQQVFSLYHVEFLFGAAIFQHREAVSKAPGSIAFAVGAILFPVSAAILHFGYSGDIPTEPHGLLGIARVTLFGSASALVLCGLLASGTMSSQRPLGKITGILQDIGNASYGLYLSHTLIIAALSVIYTRFWPRSIPIILGVALAVVLSILFALGWYRLVEEPYLKRISRRRLPTLDGPA